MTPYDLVNTKLLEMIEEAEKQGKKLPWEKPWGNVVTGPANALTGYRYNGVNVWYCSLHSLIHGYTSHGYLTKYQIFNGGKVGDKYRYQLKKGCKQLFVVYYKFPKEKELKDYQRKIERGEDAKEPKPFMKATKVYNIDDIIFNDPEERAEIMENYGHTEPSKLEGNQLWDMLETWESKPEVSIMAQNRACYVPALDRIVLPTIEQFKDQGNFLATAAHEIGHSTGADDRMGRDLKKKPSRKDYAYEELVAELFKAYMMTLFNIQGDRENLDESASYIQSWGSVFQHDKTMFLSAASKAQKAVKFALRNYPELVEGEDY